MMTHDSFHPDEDIEFVRHAVKEKARKSRKSRRMEKAKMENHARSVNTKLTPKVAKHYKRTFRRAQRRAEVPIHGYKGVNSFSSALRAIT